MAIRCEIRTEKPNLGFNDSIVSQVSAARQDFKQLDIRLTMAAVSAWRPAACDPLLRWWPILRLEAAQAGLSMLAIHLKLACLCGIFYVWQLILCDSPSRLYRKTKSLLAHSSPYVSPRRQTDY